MVLMLSMVVVGVATFCFAVVQSHRRTIIFLIGAALTSSIGLATGVYKQDEIWQAVNLPVLALILSLQIFSELLAKTGILERASRAIAEKYDNPAPVQLLVLVLVYVLSMFINNLAAMLVLLPLIFRLGTTFAFDMKRFLAALIIASNLGGASTSIGDFPNILISTHIDASFFQFMLYLGAPIAVLAAVGFLLIYRPYLKVLAAEATEPSRILATRYFKELDKSSPSIPVRRGDLMLWGLLFISLLVGIVVMPNIDSALISVGVAAILVLVMRIVDEDLRALDMSVLIFFGALFVMVGGLKASGLFEKVGDFVLASTDNPLVLALAIQWLACIVTAMFSAGPSTASLATLTHLVEAEIPGYIIWWSLSLGVLAGSSGTLIGATAGPVTASLYEKIEGGTFTFRDFSVVGLPAMLILLLGGSAYIVLLTLISSGYR